MDREAALLLYVKALLPERERALYERALSRTRAITRGMTEEARAEYLSSRAFANALYQVQKADKPYQALLRGELLTEEARAEFERLMPMIAAEAERGRDIDLPFLRSVDRSRVALKKARAALDALEKGEVRRLLEARASALADEAEERTARYLKKSDFSHSLGKEERTGDIAGKVAEAAFPKGVSPAALEKAFAPKSLTELLREELYRARPALRSCGSILTPAGGTVSEAVRDAVKKAKNGLCAGVRKRFPTDRLVALLRGNPSVRRMQRQADAALSKERKLRSALLTAIPEHYRDLYPLARQMKRRFILHLGPTNSGKTYEGVGRLHGALHGIYLGPLRLLAAEQFETLNADDVPCSLVTGEEQIRVSGSRVQSSTV